MRPPRMCVCGHDELQHAGHYNMTTGERMPGACHAYGFNETEGQGPDGEGHCYTFVDRETTTNVE